jgi:Rho guanine nucleotide exchange factor 12
VWWTNQVFWKARAKAKEEIKRQLAEFRSKRTVGLANIFGPPDATLEETLNDKNKELKIVEGILVPKLESFSYVHSHCFARSERCPGSRS